MCVCVRTFLCFLFLFLFLLKGFIIGKNLEEERKELNEHFLQQQFWLGGEREMTVINNR